MKHELMYVALALCMSTAHLQANYIHNGSSLVISPKIGSMVTTKKPVIIGLVTNSKQKPVKNKPVSVYIDGRITTSTKTNIHGVWSYRQQDLTDGFHTVQASIKSSPMHVFWLKNTLFSVNSTPICNPFYKSGFVDEGNSLVNFPFDGSSINTSKPIIVGSLLDAQFEPITEETVIITLDGACLGDVVSDHNGIFSFIVDTSLCDGNHTVEAHCVKSDTDLDSTCFTVDTTSPAAPIIISPEENQTITSGLVSVVGTSRALATITTCMDTDKCGMITYADELGNWSIEYTLEDGAHHVTAQVEDAAGNVSPTSASRTFQVQEISS